MGTKVSARVHARNNKQNGEGMMDQGVLNLGTPGTRSQRTGCPGYSEHLQVETGCPGSGDRAPGVATSTRLGARGGHRVPGIATEGARFPDPGLTHVLYRPYYPSQTGRS